MESDFQKYIHESKQIDAGPPARYELKLRQINLDKESDGESKLRRFVLGKQDPKHPHKTVLLVGATGSGKSTLIDALVNYVMGVRFEDKLWFEIITGKSGGSQTQTQTTAVSVYDIFGFEGKTVPYSLSIIDTPGFGDTRGIEHDHIVGKQLEDLFTVPDGVDTINAVGLVLKASENRLDERTVYIFNSITSLFGKDMEKNIVAMMTHSTGGKPKNALQALVEAKINCAKNNNEPVYFQFNNRQNETIEDDSDGEENDAKHAFKTSNRGMKKFTQFLENGEAQSLKSTVEVLEKRERLTACIQNAKERVTFIEEKEKAIEHNTKELEKLKTLAGDNPNIYVTIETVYKEKEKINYWWDNKATTCNKCEENCHHPGCTIAINPSHCQVMRNGNCTSCTGKCPVGDHVKENKKWVVKTKTEEKLALDLMKQKKEEKEQAVSEAFKSIINLEKEKSALEEQKKQALNEALDHIRRLEVIALNKDAVFTYQYLEFLIEKMDEMKQTDEVFKLCEMKSRMDEKNQAGANYYMRYFPEKAKQLYRWCKSKLQGERSGTEI